MASAVVSLAVMGCTRDDDSVKEKLESIDKRLEGIERALARGAGAGARGGQRQRPRGPDPSTVYAVPVADSAWEGTKDAKVTVVEAFEFA